MTNQQLIKARLTATQAKVLQLFKTNGTPKIMIEALAEYVAAWPEDRFTEAKMSRDLKELKQNGFLVSTVAVPNLLSRQTQSYGYKPKKKMIFELSSNAKSGEIVIDANRWVVLNGRYIEFDESKRRKVEERDRRKQARS